MPSTSNKFVACIANNTDTQDLYLDTAAELSKIDRKNHKQVSDKGVPLVYDLMVSVTIPVKKTLAANASNPDLLGSVVVKTHQIIGKPEMLLEWHIIFAKICEKKLVSKKVALVDTQEICVVI